MAPTGSKVIAPELVATHEILHKTLAEIAAKQAASGDLQLAGLFIKFQFAKR